MGGECDELEEVTVSVLDETEMVGATDYQELAPTALDRAQNAESGLEAEVEAGVFSDCVLVLDTNALEDPDGHEEGDEKVYRLDIGFVMDEDLELISLDTP